MYFKSDKFTVLVIIININQFNIIIINIKLLTISVYKREYERDGCEKSVNQCYSLINITSERTGD